MLFESGYKLFFRTVAIALAGLLASATMPVNAFVAFDSGQVRPLAMSPDGEVITIASPTESHRPRVSAHLLHHLRRERLGGSWVENRPRSLVEQRIESEG